EAERMAREAEKGISEKIAEIENDPATPVAGDAKGSVVIVEFFDYNCGYCKKVVDDLAKVAEEVKDVKIVLKEFPILGAASETASRAGIAAYKLDKGKYFKFHRELMHASARDEATIMKVAEKTGYNK